MNKKGAISTVLTDVWFFILFIIATIVFIVVFSLFGKTGIAEYTLQSQQIEVSEKVMLQNMLRTKVNVTDVEMPLSQLIMLTADTGVELYKNQLELELNKLADLHYDRTKQKRSIIIDIDDTTRIVPHVGKYQARVTIATEKGNKIIATLVDYSLEGTPEGEDIG